jgi:hypothetical protein
MVDYSKWDRFEDSSDDDDDEEAHHDDRFTSPTPRVTRLDAPSTITTHADGTIHIAPASAVGVCMVSSPKEAGVIVKGDNDAAADQPVEPDTARIIRFVGEQSAASARTTAAGGIVARSTVPAHWTAQGSRQRLRTSHLHPMALLMMITS